MTTPGSLKEVTRIVTSYIQDPDRPLPQEFTSTIDEYLEKLDKSDETAVQGLNKELVTIYELKVRGCPEKYAAFLSVLRIFLPAIHSPRRTITWWDTIIEPVLEHMGRQDGILTEAMVTLPALVSPQDDGDPDTSENPDMKLFIVRVFKRWAEIQSSPERDVLKESMVRKVLVLLGRKYPKCFMLVLDHFMVQRDCRDQSLALLGAYLETQPPRLHLILETPLLGSLLQCLEQDDSTTTIRLAMVALIMVLPSIPSSLPPFLPSLFNIYARLLFWERERSFAQHHAGLESGTEHGVDSPGWEKKLFDPDNDGVTLPHLSAYFTVLYGLYPLNFVEYTREPQRYLRLASNAEDVDIQTTEIQAKSERFRQHHLLHPNFHSLTAETEAKDMGRWNKSESHQVLVSCFALSVSPRPERGIIHGASSAAGRSSPLVSESDGRDGKIMADTGALLGDLSLEESDLVEAGSHAQAGPGGLSGSRLSCRLPQTGSPTSCPSDYVHVRVQDPGSEDSDFVAHVGTSSPRRLQERPSLYHQNLLLQAELQFERYQKQQHVAHIGELWRTSISEAATEAETQNLVMVNRSLKQRLEAAKLSEAQIKNEADKRRELSQKWETDLTDKLKASRAEQRKWAAETTDLKRRLERSQAECRTLGEYLKNTNQVRSLSERNADLARRSADEVERLQGEVARLHACEHEYRGKQLSMATAMQEAERAKMESEQLRMALAVRDATLIRVRREHDSKMAALESSLSERQEAQARVSSEVMSTIRCAMAASQAKHEDLLRHSDELNEKCLKLQGEVDELRFQLRDRDHPRAAERDPSPASSGSTAGAVSGSLFDRQ